MEHAALTAGWDGKWFRRAYDAYGHVVGGEECEEGKIFIEPQGMCVMAGIGVKSGEAVTALQSVKDKLDTKVRHCTAAARLHPVSSGTGRDFELPPGIQGERGHLLPQQPVGQLRRDGGWPRRPRF